MLDVAGGQLGPARDPRQPNTARIAEPISRKSIGRHRSDIQPGESRYVQWRARAEMADWGYEATAAPLGARDRSRLLRCVGEDAAWRVLRRLRVWPLVSRALSWRHR
jgi:hypothetical protein